MKPLFRFFVQLKRCSSGSALVETTVVMPVLILLMVGAVDFGLTFTTHATAQKTVRDATRYLSRVPESEICGWGLNKAKHLAVTGTLDPTVTTPVIGGYTEDMVTLTKPTAGECAALPANIVVRLEASIPYTAPMLASVGFFGFTNAFTINVAHEEQSIGLGY